MNDAHAARRDTPKTVRCDCLLADKLVVISMAPDPVPLNAIFDIVPERPVVATDSHRPQRPDAFEVQRRMSRISFE
jgi:hypothetical protein